MGVFAIHLDARPLPVEHLRSLPNTKIIWPNMKFARGRERWAASQSKVLENLQSGVWSCLILGYRPWRHNETRCNPMLLLVEWQDEKTAVRVDPDFYANNALPESTSHGSEYRTARLV